jgi:phosphatidylserine/phosphatidylglycerophosphate/cardiolipin synthase-like enzyme
MMPTWVWWGLIVGALCGLSWLCGRLHRPQAPAGHGPWGPSWAVYFSPNGGAAQAILDGIRGAKQTILVHAYLLYSTRLAGALVRAHQRGVQVHVILDAHAQPHYPPASAVAHLVAAGIHISLDAQHAWAHDKVMILDESIVFTGSYNWTVAAEQQNGENLLVIRDPRLAGVYTDNWRRHAHHSTSYRPAVPWRVRIRVVWGRLTRRRLTRLDQERWARMTEMIEERKHDE